MYLLLENFRVNALRMPFAAEFVDENLHAVIAEYLHIPRYAVAGNYRIRAKSIDARRGAPELIYTVAVEISDDFSTGAGHYGAVLSENDFLQSPLQNSLDFTDCSNKLRHPIVVGTGPAGLWRHWCWLNRVLRH